MALPPAGNTSETLEALIYKGFGGVKGCYHFVRFIDSVNRETFFSQKYLYAREEIKSKGIIGNIGNSKYKPL